MDERGGRSVVSAQTRHQRDARFSDEEIPAVLRRFPGVLFELPERSAVRDFDEEALADGLVTPVTLWRREKNFLSDFFICI